MNLLKYRLPVVRGQAEHLSLGMGQDSLEKGHVRPVFDRGNDLGGAVQRVQHRLGEPGRLGLQKAQLVHDHQGIRRYVTQTGDPQGIKYLGEGCICWPSQRPTRLLGEMVRSSGESQAG